MKGVDVHAHFVPRAWLDRVAAGEWRDIASVDAGEAVTPGHRVRLGPAFSDLEAATAGVGLRLLSIVPPLMGYWASAEAAVGYCAAFNDALLAETAASDGALPLATLPLQDPGAAVAELRRTRALGFAGAQIGARVGERTLDAPELRPVFAAAAETGGLLLVHPLAAHDEALRGALEPMVAWPLQTTAAGVAVIFGGLLEELPGLKLVLAHGGGTLPFLLARLDRGYEARPEVRERLARRPSELARRLYYDSVVFAPDALRFLVSSVGAARVLLGSDRPFPMGLEDPVGAVEAALEPEEASLVVEENAHALLELVR